MLLTTSTGVIVDEKWGVAGLVLPEVNKELLCFRHIQDQAVVPAPAHQPLCLLSVGQVVVVPDETHHCYVVCKPHSVVDGIPGKAVMCQQSEQQRAQDKALRGTLAEGADTGGVLSDPHGLWSVSEEV